MPVHNVFREGVDRYASPKGSGYASLILRKGFGRTILPGEWLNASRSGLGATLLTWRSSLAWSVPGQYRNFGVIGGGYIKTLQPRTVAFVLFFERKDQFMSIPA